LPFWLFVIIWAFVSYAIAASIVWFLSTPPDLPLLAASSAAAVSQLPVEEEEEDYVPTEENIEEELGEEKTDKCSATNLKLNVTLPQGTHTIEEPDVELILLE
jgi:hypothetical protein